MKNRFVFLLIIFLLIEILDLKAQEYISNRQSYISDNSTESIFLNETRNIIISGNNFEIELPDNKLIKGTLILKSDEIKNGRNVKIYETDKGCILVINSDNIFLNLYKTNDIAYTYYLENYVEPPAKSDLEKQKEDEERKYNFNVELYGQFSADCIKEGEVKPGMTGTAVLKILGTPNTINQTETKNKITEQLVYDDVYVYLKNSIVTAIQRHIEIK
jgi:hypothetical protein